MSDGEHPVVAEAEFDRKVQTYWLLSAVALCVFTVVGIPFLIIVVPLALFFNGKYLDAMSCTLTTRTLDVRKGLFNKVESTIPLERITDLQMFQGPIMRMLGLHGFKVETAGQSGPTGGSLVTLIGIVDAHGFKKRVMAQRENVGAGVVDDGANSDKATASSGDASVLIEIRDSLLRIEQGLAERE
ncbi:MAG: PH domain-containing protein [Planctomycetota bacterium]